MSYELKKSTSTGGDETSGYDVILDKEYSVKEFIDSVLTRTKEWGNIAIIGGCACEYKWGKLITNLPDEYLNKKISNVGACGGWSLMNYYVEIEKQKSL